MKVQVLIIAGSNEDPVLAYNKEQFIYPDQDAEDSNAHLMDIAATIRASVEEASVSIEQQVQRLVAPARGR